jgi:signal transduction histidine kinase/ligand-binding sensor domain-containing protein
MTICKFEYVFYSFKLSFHYFFFLPWIVFSSICIAQVLPFKTYSVKDGLPSNDIETISQDSYGRMWFGTTDGVSVYDGRTIMNYSRNNGLPGDFVKQILPDRIHPGVVWIIAGGGLCKFSNDHFVPIRLNVGGVTMIHQDSKGVIWCGTTVGVFTIDGDSVTRFKSTELDDQIEHIVEIGDSLLWFSHGALLISYSRQTGRFNRVDCKSYGNGNLWKLFVDSAGMLYALMGDSVGVRIHNGIVIDTKHNPATPIDMGEDNEGNLWFGGYGGISKILSNQFAEAPFQLLTTANGLPENTVRCLYVDREQNLWVGGRDKGLAKLSTGSSIRFPLGYLWYWHHHRIAVSDSSSHLWIVSDQDLLEVWRDKFQIWHSVNHRLYNRPVSMLESRPGALGGVTVDGRGRLWITRMGNTCWIVECYEIVHASSSRQFDDQPSILKRMMTVSFQNTLLGAGIFPIIASRTGEIWVASHGVACLDPEKNNPILRIYTASDGIPENYVRELYEDRHGNIWVGSINDGAAMISPDGKIRHYTTANGLPDNSIWSFSEDEAGRMLIGTSNDGLAMLDGDSISVLPQQEGLPSNSILCVTRDSVGRLWLGTSIGMVYEDCPGSKSFIKNHAFIGASAHCAGTTRNGLVWFITPTDLGIYDYQYDKKDRIQPAVYITQLHVNGFTRAMQSTMQLSHNESNCEINFIGISFKDEEAIRYMYRLSGVDKQWQGPTYNRSVTYGHLDPGSYTFEVKAINIDGTESVKPATLSFTILLPYWETWWFRTVAIIAIISIGLLTYTHRVTNLNKAQLAQQEFSRQLIESQEAERRRVAGELHDDLGQNMIVIINSAQMGLRAPTEGEMKKQLNEIVDTGTRTIQDIREIAYNLSPYHLDKIGLTESIKGMVRKLAELTGVRFIFDLEILDNIFPKELEINVYRIVQECVNNIIKHSSSSEASLLSRRMDDTLQIIIHDDGKGFDLSAFTSASNTGRGYGLSSIAERVRLLQGSLDIETAPGRGTKVTVTIPIPPTKSS